MIFKINVSGMLEIERKGKLCKQYCPFDPSPEGSNCGDWCPLFSEPEQWTDFKQNYITLNLCKKGLHCKKEDFIDERVNYEK